MPQLYDRETSQPVNPSPDDAHAGLVSGKYALDADGGKVALRGADGSIYNADPGKVAAALATNKYSLLSPQEELERQTAKEEEAKGLAGSLKEAGKSFANQALFGVPGAIQDETGTPEERAKREAVEKYHSVGRTLGGLGGFGASLFYGGELFKGAAAAGEAAEHVVMPAAEAAEAALSTRLAAKAANVATQGALFASPQALVQAAAGDPKKAAETLLWGVGTGGALGAAGEALSSAARGVGEAVQQKLADPETRAWLDQKGTEWGARAFGAQKSQIAKEGMDRVQSAVDFAYNEGLLKPGMKRADLGDVLESAQSKWGGKIGETFDSLDSVLQRGHGAGVGPKPPPEILDAALKPGQLGDALKTALDSPELRMPMNADQARALDLVAESANQIPSTKIGDQRVVTFQDAQKFVSDLRKKWVAGIQRSQAEGGLKGLETVTPLDRMKEAAYNIVKNVVHDAGDKVAIASGEPRLVGAVAEAKASYAKLATLEKFANNLQAINAGNRYVSLSDFLTMGRGPLSTATSAVGAAIGSMAGPGGAIIGHTVGKLAGMPLEFIAKKLMEDRGLVVMSSLMKKAAKEGPDVFSAMAMTELGRRFTTTMNGVTDTIKNMAVRGIASTAAAGSSDHMFHLLGGQTQGLSSDQQYTKLSDKLTSLAANPGALAAATGAAAAPFAAGSPELGAAYQAQMLQAIHYLYAALPKPPAPPPPFAPQDWQPTPQEKKDFHDKAEILNNPMRAMYHVERGTLTDAHLDSLQYNYPRVLGEMQNTALKVAANNPDLKLPVPERNSLSKLLGIPLSTPMQFLSSLQAQYSQQQPQQPQPSPKTGQRAPKGKIKNMPSQASAFTGSQGPSSTGA